MRCKACPTRINETSYTETSHSDVYSSCAVLAELLKGEKPFPQNSLALAHKQTNEVPGLHGIERPVAAVLQTGLNPEPDTRPADAKTLLAQLESAIEETHGRGWPRARRTGHHRLHRRHHQRRHDTHRHSHPNRRGRRARSCTNQR